MGKPSDLVQGTLDLLILKTISLEPKHGWAITKRIQQISSLITEAVCTSSSGAIAAVCPVLRFRANSVTRP